MRSDVGRYHAMDAYLEMFLGAEGAGPGGPGANPGGPGANPRGRPGGGPGGPEGGHGGAGRPGGAAAPDRSGIPARLTGRGERPTPAAPGFGGDGAADFWAELEASGGGAPGPSRRERREATRASGAVRDYPLNPAAPEFHAPGTDPRGATGRAAAAGRPGGAGRADRDSAGPVPMDIALSEPPVEMFGGAIMSGPPQQGIPYIVSLVYDIFPLGGMDCLNSL